MKRFILITSVLLFILLYVILTAYICTVLHLGGGIPFFIGLIGGVLSIIFKEKMERKLMN